MHRQRQKNSLSNAILADAGSFCFISPSQGTMFAVSLRSALLGLQWREQRTMGGRMRCGGKILAHYSPRIHCSLVTVRHPVEAVLLLAAGC